MIHRLSILSLLLVTVSLSSVAQIFYKIEGNGLKTPSYIFGTHHLAPLSVLDQYPSLADAIKDSEAVMGELDMTQPPMQMAMAMQKYMMVPSDSTLTKLLSPEEFAALDVKFASYAPMPGMSLTHLESMKPMVISTMVTMTEMQKSLPGFDPDNQLDAKFQRDAATQGKKIIALESPDLQASLLYSSIPISKQLNDLKDLLENPSELVENSEKLNKAYLDGDLDALLSLTESDDSDPAFMEALLTTRNRNWMKIIPSTISQHPTFIAVGALHLAGKDGIIKKLREKGFTVTPIK